MKMLKEVILQEAEVLSNNILKVDSFLNHQINTKLLMAIGKEFADYFSSINKNINKIITIETSGIAVALATAMMLDKPVVFARKHKTVAAEKDVYSIPVFSYTKRLVSRVTIAKKFLIENENILIIDDFIAHGEAMQGLLALAKQAKVNVVGIGAVIEKVFQGGGNKIRGLGYDVYSLARINKLAQPNFIEFQNESVY